MFYSFVSFAPFAANMSGFNPTVRYGLTSPKRIQSSGALRGRFQPAGLTTGRWIGYEPEARESLNFWTMNFLTLPAP
jgi:hypothetical protein